MPQAASRPAEETVHAIDWKLFLGLSRTPHGVLDMATPAMAALLWLGHFPPASVVIVGIITAFAGYTAVYALNDIVDFGVDIEKLSLKGSSSDTLRVDEILIRHPIAQGVLPLKMAIYWFVFWAAIALLGAWWLNPVCALIFLISASLEILYCKLLKITYLKIIPSAIVKATGGLAGVYAVDPNPSPAFIAFLFFWLAAWEIGGQNIANDIVDMEDDSKVSAKTILTVLGMQESVFISLAAISMAALAGIGIFWLAGSGVGMLYLPGAVIIGWKLLLQPVRRVYHEPRPEAAASLFNFASYMPPAFLLVTLIAILVPL